MSKATDDSQVGLSQLSHPNYWEQTEAVGVDRPEGMISAYRVITRRESQGRELGTHKCFLGMKQELSKIGHSSLLSLP